MICDDCKMLDMVFVYNWEFHSQCQEEPEYPMRRNKIIRIVEMNSYSMNITFDTALLRNTAERNGSKNACSVPTGSFCCLQDHAPESSFTISSQFLRMNILLKQHIFVQRRNKKKFILIWTHTGQKMWGRQHEMMMLRCSEMLMSNKPRMIIKGDLAVRVIKNI